MAFRAEYTEEQSNVALNYLSAVEEQFSETPDIYDRFLGYMKQYNGKEITTQFLVEQVAGLLYKFESLIHGFNSFLPSGWHIASSPDEGTPNSYTVTITNQDGVFTRRYREVMLIDNDGHEIQEESSTNKELQRMVALVNDIKERYSETPDIYREFLRLINPSSNIGDRQQIFGAVKALLHESPELVSRFQVLVVGDDT